MLDNIWNMEQQGTNKNTGACITDWVQYFGMYIAIIFLPQAQVCGKSPEVLNDNNGSISGLSRRKWLTYDCRFRLKALASNLKQ